MTHTILGDVNRILSTSDESNFEQNAQLMAEEGDLTEISLSETPKPQSPEIKDTDAEDISNTDNSKQGWFSKFGAAIISPKGSREDLSGKKTSRESLFRKEGLFRMLLSRRNHDFDEFYGLTRRSSSADNIQNVKPLKSILKNSSSRLSIDNSGERMSDAEAKIGSYDITGETDYFSVHGSNAEGFLKASASAAELSHTTFENTISKTSSTKALAFDLGSTEIIPTYSKKHYNRKPDNNITFKKLTPKLKMQLRDELNEFKRFEMEVHERSHVHTAYH